MTATAPAVDRRARRRRHRATCSTSPTHGRGQRAGRSPRCRRCGARPWCALFYEDSTRTRLVVRDGGQAAVGRHDDLRVGTSQRQQGREPARHRARRSSAMGVDAIVVRHALGRRAVADRPVDRRQRRSTPATAGTSTPPRRCSTATRSAPQLGRSLDGLPRRASSATSSTAGWPAATCSAFTALGARGHAGGAAHAAAAEPGRLGRSTVEPRPRRRAARSSTSCYLLRMQLERHEQALRAALREYTDRLRPHRPSGPPACPADALVMHPGPMNRGVEIAAEVAELPSAVDHQPGGQRGGRAHGGAVQLLGSGVPTSAGASAGEVPDG